MGTTVLSEDYVFLTANHDHGSTDAIWIVKQYDPVNHQVQFYKIEPGDKIGVVAIQCHRVDSDNTTVDVSYKYIALSDLGEAFVQSFAEIEYKHFIGEWKALLEEYFRKKG